MPRFRANLYLPPFPARTFHAQLPLCPNMESTSSTPSASKKHIIRKSVTSSHHPAIFRCRGRGTSWFHTRSKRPATPRGNAWWIGSSQRKSLQLALHSWSNLYRGCWQPFWAQKTPRVSTTELWPKFRIRGGGGGHFLREFKDESHIVSVRSFRSRSHRNGVIWKYI